MGLYVADFETTTDPDDTRIWAWACATVSEEPDVYVDNSWDTFYNFISSLDDKSIVWFHNMKFDGEFIYGRILKTGWEWVPDVKESRDRTFSTLISDRGNHYQAKLKFSQSKVVEIRDSLKVIPMPVEDIPAAFGLPDAKLSIDYDEERPEGHVLTDEEVAYVSEDVIIVAKAMHMLWSNGQDRLTAGSNALRHYIRSIGGDRKFRKVFPVPDYDEEVRRSYKGGFTYVNPKYQGREVGPGISFDVNSLYPAAMRYDLTPYGEPRYYTGRYPGSDMYPLYIAQISFDATLKPGHIPCIQVKEAMYSDRFDPVDYITDTGGPIERTVTSVDLDLIFSQYDVHSIEYRCGWMFKGSRTLFAKFIDEEMEVKAQATRDGNKGMRTIAKLHMNSSYGKLGTNPNVRSMKPVLAEDGRVRYEKLDPEVREPYYIAAASFITANARKRTITAAQSVYDRFIYSDTDSMYLEGTEIPDGLDVDPVRLGAWKHEHTFDRIKVLRPKTYVFEEGGKLEVHACGMPKRCVELGGVTFENFEIGASYQGKLRPRHTPGGIVLEETTFTIR